MPCECERDPVFASQLSDDETLFAFYTLLRYAPHVVVVLRSFKEEQLGGPTWAEREAETDCAMASAGMHWEQWAFSDLRPDWNTIAGKIDRAVIDHHHDVVIAPAYEEGGHEHHNALAIIAKNVARDAELISYTTYVRGQGRSEHATEITPTTDEEIWKRAALACYESQIAYEPTAPWFGHDQREFVL